MATEIQNEVARRGTTEREAFLLHYAPLVKILVSRIAGRLPRNNDLPDLMGQGTTPGK